MKNLRAVHYATTGAEKVTSNSRAICNHHLGLSIGRRRSLPPLLTADPLKITCDRCKTMCATMIERATVAAEVAK